MKARLFAGIFGVALLIAAAHIWINVGFDNFAAGVKGLFQGEKEELVVGFLPVT